MFIATLGIPFPFVIAILNGLEGIGIIRRLAEYLGELLKGDAVIWAILLFVTLTALYYLVRRPEDLPHRGKQQPPSPHIPDLDATSLYQEIEEVETSTEVRVDSLGYAHKTIEKRKCARTFQGSNATARTPPTFAATIESATAPFTPVVPSLESEERKLLAPSGDDSPKVK